MSNAVLQLNPSLSAGPFLRISNDLSDVSDAATARTNLGLVAGGAGDIWVEKAGDTMSGALVVQGVLTMASELQHESDVDTKIGFTADKQTYTVGGIVALQLTNAAQDLVEIGDVAGTGDVDVNMNAGKVFLRGSDGFFGIGTTSPGRDFSLESSNRFLFLLTSTDAGAAAGPLMEIYRSSATPAASDDIGEFRFLGNNSTPSSFSYARIRAGIVDPTAGSEDGELKFITTKSGSSNTVKMLINQDGNIGIGAGAVTTPLAKIHVDQDGTTAAIPVAYFDQADVSEEMFQFQSTIGTGNAIEAVGAKTLTTTHFIKVTITGGLTRYFPVGTIA